MIAELDSDPWGLPYRLVLGKLRTASVGLTETLKPEVLGRLLGSLFPHRDEGEIREIGDSQVPEDADIEEIIQEELIRILRKKGGRNTAPGTDGIKMTALRNILIEDMSALLRCYNQCLKRGSLSRKLEESSPGTDP